MKAKALVIIASIAMTAWCAHAATLAASLAAARSADDVASVAMERPGERVAVLKAALSLGVGRVEDLAVSLFEAGATPHEAVQISVRAAPRRADAVAVVLALALGGKDPDISVVEAATKEGLRLSSLPSAERDAEWVEVLTALSRLRGDGSDVRAVGEALLREIMATSGSNEALTTPIAADPAANSAPSAN